MEAQRLEKYRNDLKEIRLRIGEQIYLYLLKYEDEESILDALTMLLDSNYNEALDWLYSTFNTRTVAVRIPMEGMDLEEMKKIPQLFVVEVFEDKILVSFNTSALRRQMLKDAILEGMKPGSNSLEVLTRLALLETLPIELGKVF